jgi:hypothetical protein
MEEKLKLEYNYSERAKELLAIIGEAYLGMDTPDVSYYRERLYKAINELDKLEKDDTK